MGDVVLMWPKSQDECDHPKMASFDESEANGMLASEVRQRWPRGSGVCPDCGMNGIFYASYLHYLAGDW